MLALGLFRIRWLPYEFEHHQNCALQRIEVVVRDDVNQRLATRPWARSDTFEIIEGEWVAESRHEVWAQVCTGYDVRPVYAANSSRNSIAKGEPALL